MLLGFMNVGTRGAAAPDMVSIPSIRRGYAGRLSFGGKIEKK
jgi:hypothetical protein